MLMISADARSRGWAGWSFVPILWWPSMILAGYIRPVISGGDVASEESRTQVQAGGRQKQRNDQADTAKHGNRLARLDTQSGFGRTGMYSCSRIQAWAWRKRLPASHRLLPEYGARMCGLTPEMTARRYRKISARVTIVTCQIFASRVSARRQVRCSPAAIAAPRKLLLPPAC